VDREGRSEPVAPLAGLPIASVRLSPDNRYLAYRTVGRAAEVRVHDRELQTSRRITREGRAMHLCWTPNGTRLTFAYSRAGAPGIVWTAADGSGPAEPEPLVTSKHVLSPSAWSRDGRRLAYSSAETGESQVHVAPSTRGAKGVPVTAAGSSSRARWRTHPSRSGG
jgi:hypothetical protein